MSLDEIGRRHGTDKSSLHHNYLEFYETFLAPRRNRELRILEVGVLNGQSLRTWEDYFLNASIVGVDINPATRRFASARCQIEIADQSDVQQLTTIAQKHGPFDIVVEDGSHMWEHQITSLRVLFPFVNPDGVYIVEDLQTNYGGMVADYRGIASEACVEYLKRWLDLRVANEEIDITKVEDAFLRTYGRTIKHLSFYNHACLIQKNWSPPEQPVNEPLVLDAIRTQSLLVLALAHIAHLGDVSQDTGSVNPPVSAARDIQGLQLNSGLNVLEYKARKADGVWTDWVSETAFVGTRGEAKALAGLAVRVKAEKRSEFKVRTSCRFSDAPQIFTSWDGEEIASSTASRLCAVQIDLTKASSTSPRG